MSSNIHSSQIKAYQEAISEAKRFIKKAEAAITDLTPDKEEKYEKYQSKHNAAAKRASMDLTRALVDVRGRRR